MTGFSLVDEPWIPVQTQDGPATLSLHAVFSQADRVTRLTGEVPTQAFATLRLLLAIVHDAIGIHDWDSLDHVRANGVNRDAVHSYLERWRDRFDLFHPERPFMQVAALRTAKGEASGLEKIIADVPNGSPLFTTRMGVGLASVDAAEAARWLVHTQAFDPAGIRSGAIGDAFVVSGKGYPIGPAWAGQLGGIVIHGSTLAQTLVLNLTVTSGDPADRPVWALDVPQTAVRSEEALPPGTVSLLVWQSRRVRLVGDSRRVTGVVLCQGDRMTPQNRRDVEPMSAWRYSEPQTKKLGRPTYMPNKHDPDRSLWRTLPAVLACDVRGDSDRLSLPTTLDSLRDCEELDGTYRVQAIGIRYGGNEATIDEIVDDAVDLRASVLRRESGLVRAMMDDAVTDTEEAVRALGTFAANLARCAGESGDSSGESARSRVTQQAWSALDQPARAWIETLESSADVGFARLEWEREANEIIAELGDRLYQSAPPSSVKGRVIRAGSKDRFVTADLAALWFRTSLRKALPLAHLSQTKD